MRFLTLLMTWSLNLLVVAGIFFGVWYWGKTVGIAEGHIIAKKEALKTNPPSEELEIACAGLWIGEQNKKYFEKENRRAR